MRCETKHSGAKYWWNYDDRFNISINVGTVLTFTPKSITRYITYRKMKEDPKEPGTGGRLATIT